MLHKHFFLGVLMISLLGVTSQTQQAQQQPQAPAPAPAKDTPATQHVAQPPSQPQPAVRPSVQSAPSTSKVAVKSAPVPVRGQQVGQAPRTAPAAKVIAKAQQPKPQQLAKSAPVPASPLKIDAMLHQYASQFAPKPSYNYRMPVQSSSLNNLVSSFVGSLTNRIGKRSGKGSSLDNAMYNLNAIPDSTGASGTPEFSLNNINAMNEMISTALNAMNVVPGQPVAANPGLMNQIGSFLSTNLGKSKKIFDLPKQLYKSIGEKISGAGEAAVSATVPIKDSFLSTLKSFYSYLKPARSSPTDPMAAAAAAAAGAYAIDGQAGYNSALNFKRRQSLDPSQPYPYFAQNNQRQQQPQMNWQQQQQQWGHGNFGNNGGYPKQQQLYPNAQSAMQQPMQPVESNRQPQPQQFNAEQYAQAFLQQYVSAEAQANSAKAVPYGTRMQPLESQQMLSIQQQQQQSGLYARSKQLFNKIARKATRTTMAPLPQQQFPGQFVGSPQSPQNQLPSQILSKVQSKLGTLPTAYNQAQQAQQAGQQPTQSQWTQQVQQAPSSQQQPQQNTWSQSQSQPSISSYFTQQPSSQFPYSQLQPISSGSQQIPIQQYLGQVAGTSPSSSTPSSASVVTSTSVSISKSISTSQQNQQQQAVHDQQGLPDDQTMMADQSQDGPLYYYESNQAANSHQDQHQDESQSMSQPQEGGLN